MNSASVVSGKVDVFTVIKVVLSSKIKNITYINLMSVEYSLMSNIGNLEPFSIGTFYIICSCSVEHNMTTIFQVSDIL